MLKIEKTVFISYRRMTGTGFALAIHQNLTNRGYDVFFDYDSIKAGDFEQIILRSIESRAHFVVILTPSALERCAEPSDWLRREIEHALEHKRNVVPLTFEGFDFKDMERYLPSHIAQRLSRYNGLRVPSDYFSEAMNKLVERCNIPLDAVLHPPSPAVRAEEARQQRVIVAQPTVTERQLSAEEYFERGIQHLKTKRYDAAIADYNEAIHLNPNFTIVYNHRGATYYKKGDYDNAIADYMVAIRLNPDYSVAYNNRAATYAKKGEYDKAIADYSEAIRLDPDYSVAYNNRGATHSKKGDDDSAIADYSEAIRLNPNFAKSYYNRGSVYLRKGNYDHAIADYNKAIHLNPNLSLAYNNRGFAYYKQGNYDRAIADYDHALTIDPSDETSHRNRELALRRKHGWRGLFS